MEVLFITRLADKKWSKKMFDRLQLKTLEDFIFLLVKKNYYKNNFQFQISAFETEYLLKKKKTFIF